jgi:hypothetical protein
MIKTELKSTWALRMSQLMNLLHSGRLPGLAAHQQPLLMAAALLNMSLGRLPSPALGHRPCCPGILHRRCLAVHPGVRHGLSRSIPFRKHSVNVTGALRKPGSGEVKRLLS